MRNVQAWFSGWFGVVLAPALALVLCGCGAEPELQVPAREIRYWPAEQFERIRSEPQQRFFAITALPPQVFFRAGSECGAIRSLRIQVEGWPAVGALTGTAAPAAAPPPAVQFWVSDRHAQAAARFSSGQAIAWEPQGGREVVEVRATEAGASPTPAPTVRFEPGWLYRLTFLAELEGRSDQRSIWVGPSSWQERAALWDSQ